MQEIIKWKEKELSKMFKEEQALYQDIIPLTKQLLRGYISNWKRTGLEMIWVEKEFSVDLGSGITRNNQGGFHQDSDTVSKISEF